MLEILKSMVKEEWRMHSTMFGSFMFALFPFMVMLLAFVGVLFAPVFIGIVPANYLVLMLHYVFVLFGLSIGAFGLLGREIMNRRFGSASLVAFSSRTLPVSLRKIFAAFVLKDIIYYFFLWVLPFAAGMFFAAPLLSLGFYYPLMLLLTLTLSFMIGLSVVFLLSTIYAHSMKLLVTVIAICTIFAAFYGYLSMKTIFLLPPHAFFLAPALDKIGISLVLIVLPITLSLAFLKIDYPVKKKNYKNIFDYTANFFSFSENSIFMSKDLIDLQRSEGGFGKIIFSFLFPVALIWLILYFFMGMFSGLNLFLVFAVLLGAVSSSVYNWLTEFDVLSSYAFLPVKVSSVIRSKITGYIIINIVCLPILLIAAFSMNSYEFFAPAFASFVSISMFSLSVIVYLTGLNPNAMLYNASIFMKYIGALVPPLIVAIFLSALNPLYTLLTILLIPASLYITNKAIDKWDRWEKVLQ